MDAFEKMKAIDAIAEEDEVYQVWFKSHQELVKTFESYAAASRRRYTAFFGATRARG